MSMKGSENDLEEFRRRWREELRGVNSADHSPSSSRGIPAGYVPTTSSPAETSRSDKAVRLYLSAEDLERAGDVYGALSLYQRAVQLDADVEQHVRRLISQRRSADRSDDGESGRVSTDAVNEDHSLETDCSVGDSLVEQFGRLTASDSDFCSPAIPRNECHIGKLPADLMQYLLSWVVSDDVDVISLEQLACVSRGFYLYCRSPAIWRRICLRVHGSACLGWTVANSPCVDWRSLYLSLTPLRFDGCYTARASYVRHGDDSGFRDSTYRGWQLVVHYRLMRFLANGRVMMALGADGPETGWRRLMGEGGSAVISGRYRIKGDRVLAVLHRPRRDHRRQMRILKRDKHAYDPGEQHLHMDLSVKRDDVRGLHLCWNSYEIITRYSVDGHRRGETAAVKERVESVAINDQLPPLIFSRVPDFLAIAEHPLP